MSIDPFTLAAQFVNFFILLWLLKYFLYEPITRAMDTRQEAIEERFHQADEAEARAREAKRNHESQQEKLSSQREEILREAREDARRRREELIDETREEIEALRERWQEEIHQEQRHFLRELRSRAGRTIREGLGDILEKLADETLESRMVTSLMNRLDRLSETDRERFMESLRHADQEVTVRSAMPLTDPDRERVTRRIHEVFGETVDPRFEVDDDLVCGIELHGEGRAIGWSVRDALDRIAEQLEELIQRETQAPTSFTPVAPERPSSR